MANVREKKQPKPPKPPRQLKQFANDTTTHPLMEWRKKEWMTQKEFADALGVNVRTLQSWEQGVSKPRLSQQWKIAQMLGIEPEQIIFEDKRD